MRVATQARFRVITRWSQLFIKFPVLSDFYADRVRLVYSSSEFFVCIFEYLYTSLEVL